ncbi:hypothetical protein EYF80_043383 [Liparis tanakae]|uniref:Uncharacterized protein n=1 Tax=Liparis tanakae TaxID=230148 RepID=A0A4Z2FYY4_9TELE|nr:hypothetical protein EYF80_043383 [Liparis tanakae]
MGSLTNRRLTQESQAKIRKRKLESGWEDHFKLDVMEWDTLIGAVCKNRHWTLVIAELLLTKGNMDFAVDNVGVNILQQTEHDYRLVCFGSLDLGVQTPEDGRTVFLRWDQQLT